MNYLKEYNIGDKEIENIVKVLEDAEVDIAIFQYNDTKIRNILDLFVNIGVTNIYPIIIAHPYMFYDTVESIQSKIKGYKNKSELAKLINDNPENLSLIGIY